MYDYEWWVGFVLEMIAEDGDALIKFMPPHRLAWSSLWSNKEDTCFVPIIHVLCTIDPPKTSSGRQYTLSSNNLKAILTKFNEICTV